MWCVREAERRSASLGFGDGNDLAGRSVRTYAGPCRLDFTLRELGCHWWVLRGLGPEHPGQGLGYGGWLRGLSKEAPVWSRPDEEGKRGWLAGWGCAGGGTARRRAHSSLIVGVWGSLVSAAGWLALSLGAGEAGRDWLGLRGGERRGREGRHCRPEVPARHLRARRCGWVVGAPGTELSGGAVEAAVPAAQRGGSSGRRSRAGRAEATGLEEVSSTRGRGLAPAAPAPHGWERDFYLEASDHELRGLHFLVWRRQPGESSWRLSSRSPRLGSFCL